MAYFPLFIDLKGKKCSVAGGGRVALRKIESLLQFQGDVEAVAPVFCDGILALRQRLSLVEREARPEDFAHSFLVVAATDAREANHEIADYCRKLGIFVNVIDCREECTFLFPATVKREDISIGITTSGKSPALSSAIRKSVESSVPESYGELSRQLGFWREKIKDSVEDGGARRAILNELVHVGIENGGRLSRGQVQGIVGRYDPKKGNDSLWKGSMEDL